MEYFDVVDKNRVQLNYKKIRGEKLEENEFNTGVEMWIINNNKILMTQRSEQKSHPGQWETPGGCSQAGESIIDTIKREMIEEIGVNFNKDEFCLIGTHLYKKQFVDIFLSEKEILKNIFRSQGIVPVTYAERYQIDSDLEDIKAYNLGIKSENDMLRMR